MLSAAAQTPSFAQSLWGVLIGGSIAIVAGTVTALITAKAAGRRQSEEFQHQRVRDRYDSTVAAYLAFVSAVAESRREAKAFEARHSYNYADETNNATGEPYEPWPERTAEEALELIRLTAPAVMHEAGREYLDAFYMTVWVALPGGRKARQPDLAIAVAESKFIEVSRKALLIDE